MELNQIIQTWYRLANGHDVERSDMFFRFVAIWVAFNALYTSRHSHEFGDREQVRAFAGEPDAIARHQQLLSDDLGYERAVQTLRERGVRNLSNQSRADIRDVRNLVHVLTAVYTVRCNLFHGGKAPGNPRDESLVAASHTIVSQLIAPYLETSSHDLF